MLLYNAFNNILTMKEIKEIKEMNNYRAVGLIEGFESGTENEIIEAWQHLHDTKTAYKLQGWYGRTAKYLIEVGTIKE
jgi:hypothetical protein